MPFGVKARVPIGLRHDGLVVLLSEPDPWHQAVLFVKRRDAERFAELIRREGVNLFGNPVEVVDLEGSDD